MTSRSRWESTRLTPSEKFAATTTGATSASAAIASVLGPPQAVALNSTVHGTIGGEDVDYYVVDAKKGQRISAEVEGIRLGNTFFDPYVAIMDMGRFELSAGGHSDVFGLTFQDPIPPVPVPATRDPELLAPVNQLLREVYDRAGFELVVDYGQCLDPPLTADDHVRGEHALTRQRLDRRVQAV